MNERRVIEVDDFQHRVMMEALADRRNDFIAANKPTEDVNEVLLKVIDAPTKKSKKRDLPGGPVVGTPHGLCRAHGRDPWSGNCY